MKLDPNVYLEAAGDIADAKNIGCCGAIEYACRDLEFYAVRGPTPEEVEKKMWHIEAFAKVFMPEWGSLTCYWWSGHLYYRSDREARTLALLWMYHLTKEENARSHT